MPSAKVSYWLGDYAEMPRLPFRFEYLFGPLVLRNALLRACGPDSVQQREIPLVERTLPKKTPRLRHEFFGAPPLLKGEDSAAYSNFLAKTIAALNPADFIEEVFVRDFVDLDWEIVRMRRLKVDLINQVLAGDVKDTLTRLLEKNNDDSEEDDKNEVDVDALVAGWAIGDRRATKEVEEILQARRITIHGLSVAAFASQLAEVDAIERLVSAMEARRNGVLRDIERRRQPLAEQLRRIPEQIDAEYKVVGQSGRVSKIASQSG